MGMRERDEVREIVGEREKERESRRERERERVGGRGQIRLGLVWHQTTGSLPVSTARRTSLGPGVALIKTTTLLSIDEVNPRLGGGGGC